MLKSWRRWSPKESSSLQSFCAPIAFSTIATPSYIAQATILIDSLRLQYGPDAPVFLLLIAEGRPSVSVDASVIYFDDVPNPFRFDMALRYNDAELSSAYKPFLLTHIRSSGSYSAIVYLDADFEVFSRLHELENSMRAGSSVVLTPHSVIPLGLGRSIDDRALLTWGAYNAGLVSVGCSPSTAAFLAWWSGLNGTECYQDESVGYASRDQKWLALAPAYFANVTILRHPGYNIGHYNLNDRTALLAGPQVRAFHYTGLRACNWDVARYFDMTQVNHSRVLSDLLQSYADRVRDRMKHDYFEIWPKSFQTTPSGHFLSETLRKRYRQRCPPLHIASWDESDSIIERLEMNDDVLSRGIA